jgi:alkylation response protein AidB-like acyl-CoA dehydrogenase
MRKVIRQMGSDGWLGIGWPTEYGGQGRSAIEQFVFFDESMRARAPVPMLTINTVGPTIMNRGTEAQKDFFLPKILAGEIHFCIGYSEADAGTDLASLTTRADPDGDDFIINGQKLWTSLASDADYCWLAVRTDQEAAKHDGLSMFLVDRGAQGVVLEALVTTSRMPESMMTLEGVAVAPDAILGQPGQGDEIVAFIDLRANAALCNLALGVCEAALEMTAEYSKTRKQFDQPIAMFQAVSHREADAYIDTQSVRLTALEVAWLISVGRDAQQEVAIAKHFASDAGYRVTFSAQHIHGGIGVDREYPVHRYYVYARHLELMLGGSTHHLRRLGKLIAEEAA